jgi:hypothetical protein
MIELPDAQSHRTVADWIEIQLSTTSDAISKLDVASIIESLTNEDTSDAFLSSVWNELLARQGRYLNPPFNVSDRRVSKSNNCFGVEYIACLILSIFGASNSRLAAAKLFERISALALKEYINGDVFIFGWPVLNNTGTAIEQRIIEISNTLRERLIESPAERYKDRGVDIIAWKSFAERRSSQCIILAQCAAGKNWQNKTRDLPIESWKQYIHWACDPITAFFVPCIIPDDLWHDISREAGILFDRIRIMNLLPNGISDPDLNAEVTKWVEEQLAEFSLN